MALTLDYPVVQLYGLVAFKPIFGKGFKLGLPLSLKVVQESKSPICTYSFKLSGLKVGLDLIRSLNQTRSSTFKFLFNELVVQVVQDF
jgi:hypothetical protein